MTDSKALIERLRADWPEILVEKHWIMDSDAIEEQRREAADHIEKLEADNARLREALEPFARAQHIVASVDGERIRCVLTYPPEAKQTFTLASLNEARAALQETSHDA